ncbi:hypothetical protein SBW85_07750 [Vibrio plantisponsor]|uniref:Uncharacterized protein n=1 Tax=Vibrio plantisponsor TaxID=664643 RepID=A0ABU4IJI5_9VIBR|nr:hypothetical protein [Vibrio plantisponsor]MDW6017670.1 hypothetical protein [Vibrio plantisponsor]NNM40503.1 hypothetical protein [Vibrio plantisponsor]
MKSEWLKFESRLAGWMKSFGSEILQFTNGYQAIPGFPSDGFRADGLLTDGKVVVALEVEVKQTHPDTNVGKFWLLNQYKSYEKVVLFHVYTPEYNSYPWRLELGKFYASKMSEELPFEYHLLDLRQTESIDSAFDMVTCAIEGKIRSEFSGNTAQL